MTLLEVVTPPSIYFGCSTWKTFWEENFTLCEFTPANMKNYDRPNVNKHIDIKDSDKYITLDVSLKFVSMDKIRITYSDPKDYLGISEKGLITYLYLNTIVRSKK